MSLSSAISNALSGMRATSAAADLTGSNLANATNENYARRDLVIQANMVGQRGGVQIVGIQRQSNPVMAATWRDANSTASMAHQRATDAATIQSLYGDPTQGGSLANRLTQFRESLISAAARPDLTERLGEAVLALDDLVTSVNDISDGIQHQREIADRRLSVLADRMNDILSDLQSLNVNIVDGRSQGKHMSSLLDRQDQLVDELSGLTDVRVYPRDHGTIAIYSKGGSILLDQGAADISFTATGTITPDMTVDGGHLGVFLVDGDPVAVGAESGKLRGGEIGALFEFRDVTSVAEQRQIDAFAFELADRINDPSIDPSRSLDDIGFVTDLGDPLDAADLVGLSNRLQVNTDVMPSGGDPVLLRDGLLSGMVGPVGNAALLNGINAKITTATLVGSGSFAGESLSLEGLATRTTNRIAYEMTRRQEQQAFASSQSETLRSYKLETAVDSDAELQNLMLLEQAYAANAQVIRTVDEMMDTLMGILR